MADFSLRIFRFVQISVVVPLTPEEKLSRYLLTDKYLHVLGEYYKFKYEASMKFIVNRSAETAGKR